MTQGFKHLHGVRSVVYLKSCVHITAIIMSLDRYFLVAEVNIGDGDRHECHDYFRSSESKSKNKLSNLKTDIDRKRSVGVLRDILDEASSYFLPKDEDESNTCDVSVPHESHQTAFEQHGIEDIGHEEDEVEYTHTCSVDTCKD